MRYTCKKLTEMFKEVNQAANVEVLKCNEKYQLKVNGGKYIVEASILKELVGIVKSKTSEKSMVLTLTHKTERQTSIGLPLTSTSRIA